MKLLICLLLFVKGVAMEEILDLDIISYEDFYKEESLPILHHALHEKGIVGISKIPGYKEKVMQLIQSARDFSALPESVKESYAPDHAKGETFLGYEKGKEKFKRPDGRWVIDDQKVSYYGYVPDDARNKWPKEIDLQIPFEALGVIMADMAVEVMKKIDLIGEKTQINLEGIPRVGRLLYYQKNSEGIGDNPHWCGAHFDHGMFTALLPAFYFSNGKAIEEPSEAGLFVKTGGTFKKVVANDPDVLLFQVGEFGQLVTNDNIQATEHRVHKAEGAVQRFTMALFFDAPMDTTIRSTSVLTADSRYGGIPGAPCTYRQWHEESFKRYIVK